MKYKSAIIASGSGSVGGCVFSRNRFGQYCRNRSIPVNPNTANQQVSRASLSQLATRWSETLNAVQRDGWRTYAAAVPRTGPLGDPIFLTGFNWYVACNAARLSNFGASEIIDDAPATLTMGTFTAIQPGVPSEATQQMAINFDNTDEWAVNTGGYLLAQFSRPQNPAKEFFKGPFRASFGTTVVAGDTTTPPTSPANMTVPFSFQAGQAIWVRLSAINADARITDAAIFKQVAAA